MEQRIAPNNQLPATHFIEVWKGKLGKDYICFDLIEDLNFYTESTKDLGHKTIAIFRIRENQLPTLHNFNK